MAHHPDSKRLNKAISDSGFCSRRQADKHIEQRFVTVNGEIATLGDRAMPKQTCWNNLYYRQKN
jgi:23S rRNA pseudouridine2604 synthase